MIYDNILNVQFTQTHTHTECRRYFIRIYVPIVITIGISNESF